MANHPLTTLNFSAGYGNKNQKIQTKLKENNLKKIKINETGI